MTETPNAWLRTTPIAVFHFLGGILKVFVKNFTNVAASAAGLVILVKQHILLAAVVVALGIAAMLVTAFLRYWFFQFRIEEDGILIRRGVLKKTQLDMRFDRIQGISTEQSFIYRQFGLVVVRFNTAGAAGDEGYLPAVTTEFVARIRERVDTRTREREEAASTDGEVLLALDGGDVMRVGLTEPRVLHFALFGAALTPAFGRAFEGAYEKATNFARESLAVLSDLGFLLAAITVVALFAAVATIFLMGSVVVALLRFHGYELIQVGGTLRASSGLLTRKATTVEIGKVQQLTIIRGLLMGWIRRYRLQALPATGGPVVEGLGDGSERLTVPLAGDRTVENLRERVFGAEGRRISVLPRSNRFAAVSPYSIMPPTLWVGLVPGVAAAVVLAWFFGAPGLLALGWVVIVALVAWQRWRRRGYLYDADAMVCRSGFVGYRLDAFLFRKVQRVRVSQSPLQRRKGLAALHLELATGNVAVPFIEQTTARGLRDYILYKVEESRRPWY